MPMTIPNEASAPANVVQATIYQADIDIIVDGIAGNGVISGCAVSAQTTPNATVAVAAGSIRVAGAVIAVAGSNVSLPAADATHPSWVLIVANSSGVLSAIGGTAAATPLLPSVPGSSVALAAIWWPATASAATAEMITDKRVIVLALGSTSAPGLLTLAAEGESAAGKAVQANDSRLSNARTPTSHTHPISEVTGLQLALDSKAATSHTHAAGDITSGTLAAARLPSASTSAAGIVQLATDGETTAGKAVQGNDARLNNSRTPTAHTHPISEVTGLQLALDGKAAASHLHAISDVTELQTVLDGKASATHVHAAGDITSGTIAAARLPSASTSVAGIVELAADGETTAGLAVQASDGRLSNSRAPSGGAGGVLSGTYPNPGFAVDMATQAELDSHAAATTGTHGITAAGAALTGAANAAAQRTALGLGTAAQSASSDFVSATTTRAANLVLAGPTSGGATAPSFRGLVAGDIPNLDAAKITTGALAPARGGSLVYGRAVGGGETYLSIPGVVASNPGTRTLANNRIYYMPIAVTTPITIDRLVIEVTVAGSAGTVVRLGIYNSDINLQPTSLILDAGTVPADAVAVQNLTLGSPLSLAPGLYLIALVSDGVPTLRVLRGGANLSGFQTAFGASPFIAALYVGNTYGAFPSTGVAWTNATSSGSPLDYMVLCRVSTP